jgi:hypothetical protein
MTISVLSSEQRILQEVRKMLTAGNSGQARRCLENALQMVSKAEQRNDIGTDTDKVAMLGILCSASGLHVFASIYSAGEYGRDTGLLEQIQTAACRFDNHKSQRVCKIHACFSLQLISCLHCLQ